MPSGRPRHSIARRERVAVAVVPRGAGDHDDFLRGHEAGEESDSELSDEPLARLPQLIAFDALPDGGEKLMRLGFGESDAVVGDGQRRLLARTGQFEGDEPIGRREGRIDLLRALGSHRPRFTAIRHEDLWPAIKVVREDVNDPAEVDLKSVFG